MAPMKNITAMIGKDGTDMKRQEQMEEVYVVKDRLAREGFNVALGVIKSALLMPEDQVRIPG